jgi:hypothetical protein
MTASRSFTSPRRPGDLPNRHDHHCGRLSGIHASGRRPPTCRDWLRANGTEGAPGTMVSTICGDLRREGVFELPLGSPLRYLVEELAGGPPAGRAIKAIFPGASNTVIVPQQPRRAAGLRLGAAGGFGPGRGRVRGVRRLGLHGAGGLAVLAIPVRGVMRAVPGLQVRDRRGHPDPASAGGGRRIGSGSGAHPGPGRGSTGEQKCALPTGESLLLESLVQGFQAEFASHIGRSCPLPRELPSTSSSIGMLRPDGSPTTWPMHTSSPTGPTLPDRTFLNDGSQRNVPSSWLDPRWWLARLLPERPFKQVLVDLGVE